MQDESNADFSVKYYGGDKGFEGAAGDDRKVCTMHLERLLTFLAQRCNGAAVEVRQVPVFGLTGTVKKMKAFLTEMVDHQWLVNTETYSHSTNDSLMPQSTRIRISSVINSLPQETPRKKPLQHGTLPFESIQTGPQVSASSGHGVLKRDICLKQLRERSSVSEDDVPPPCQSSEAILDEILTEIRTLLPDAKEGHFLCLERTLREMGVLSRRDMKQVKPVDLVNALGTDKANKVAAHFNPDYAESSVHKILGAVGRSYENAEFALHTFSAAAQEIASTLREECKMTRDCLLGAIRSVNMCPSEADRASECTTSGKDEDFPGLKRAQEVRKMEKQESTCSERTLLHENRDKNKDMKKGYWKLLKPYFKLRHKHRNL
ncbi:uncharacterized protein LOC144108553 [Amblyomma americanum]